MKIKTINTKPKPGCVPFSFVRSIWFKVSSCFLWSVGGGAAAWAQVGAPPPSGGPFTLEPVDTQHEIALSADYLYGLGNVTLPFNFATATANPNVGQDVLLPDRKSDYFGATVSYSFGQTWYVDLSYAHGSSKGDFTSAEYGPGSFTIDDDWFQGYVRYTLRRKRLSAYLRAGVSFVPAELKDLTAREPQSGQAAYQQNDDIKDVLGNLGFGVTYNLFKGKAASLGLQLEGEGFYGHRRQDSHEIIPTASIDASASIDNSLFGGIGRLTARFEYQLSRSGLLRLFADAGVAVKYSAIHYSENDLGWKNELLWGPYGKVGLRYSF